MKTTKIVMAISAAAVMALSATGCKQAGTSLGNDFLSYNSKGDSAIGAEATATINFTNENADEYARGMKLFDNKKKGITAMMTMDLSEDTNPGAMSIVFDLEKKDGKYNFCLAGFKNNSGKLNYYIAYYNGVAEADFDKSNFGVPEGSRTDIANFTELDTITPSNGKLSCVMEIEAVKADGEGNENDAAYNVHIYAPEATEAATMTKFKGISNKTGEELKTIHNTAEKTVVIKRIQVQSSSTKVIENKMGFYANVYGRKTLNGTWLVADMKHEANVAKTVSDDDSFIKLNF